MASTRGRIAILSEDLIIEILSRLPVKSLMRFKCVCKCWYNIISSRDFVYEHLGNYYYNDKTNTGCLLATHEVEYPYLRLIPIVPDEMRSSLPDRQLDFQGIQFLNIFGPLNGIYCVIYENAGHDVFAYWNPATEEFRPLPPQPDPIMPDLPHTVTVGDYRHGFGFDIDTLDYKLVVIRVIEEYEDEDFEVYLRQYIPSQAMVYSLSADSWKILDSSAIQFECELSESKCYTYTNGMYFWETRWFLPHEAIVTFDMTIEVFRCMTGPDCLQGLENCVECLAIHDCTLGLYVFKEFDECLDIWVMDMIDYEWIWVKKITVGPLPEISHPVRYWKHGQVVLLSKSYTLVLCDSSTGKIKDLGHVDLRDIDLRGMLIYKDSLLQIVKRNCHMRYWHINSEENSP